MVEKTSMAVGQGKGQSFFASGVAVVAFVALVRLVLYFFAGSHYGYFRDELYYLACGEHPAWGYVDQPPLIGWVAWLLQHTIGTSLWALRLLPALAGVGTIVLTGLLARVLGGGRWAMFLASLSALMAPVLLALSHLFTMNAFDQLFWTALAFLLVRVAKSGDERLWLPIGVLAGITILNKYGVIFWLSGVIIGMCLTELRQSFRHWWFWLGCGLAAAIALPNFLWQWRYQFPFLQLMHNVRESGRDIVLRAAAIFTSSGPDAWFCRGASCAFRAAVFLFGAGTTVSGAWVGLFDIPCGVDVSTRQDVLPCAGLSDDVCCRGGVD
jgi:4-amino-4-deoxy-L-arabinose transferase-like glycosyltransferase